MRLALATAITVLAIMVAGAYAGNIYVDDDATYPGGGTLLDPYKRITTALAVATYGDTIHVAAGLYNVTRNGESFPLTMIDGVSLSGENRDTTTLDAEGQDYTSYHVIYCDGVDDLTIEGFTITGGKADGTQRPDNAGGGIHCRTNSSPTIQNNTITGNSADYCGGGIFCYGSSPTIENNTVNSNSAEAGGGISCYVNSSPTVENNTIKDNCAVTFGGGIACHHNSSPAITSNTIRGNSAGSHGGGAIGCLYSSPTISDNIITENTSDYWGGGILSQTSSPTIQNNTVNGNSAQAGGGIHCRADSSPIITNCIVNENSAYHGGGIYCNESSPTVEDCAIADNTAVDDGGGIKAISLCELTILNCLVTGNEAGRAGGGIHCWYNYWVTLTNCTFADNIARWPAVGGAIYRAGTVTVTNCILWGDSPNEVTSMGSDVVGVTYSDVDQDGYAGSNGNIRANPQFRSIGLDDMPYDGYFLYHETNTTGSPCIDAGHPSDNPFGGASNSDYSTDHRNNASPLMDTNRVDMGYHYKRWGCTFIELISFQAKPKGGCIVLTWETGAEIDNAGFVLFRIVAGASDYVQLSDLIAAEGTPAAGASYSFVESDVEPGVTYNYWLIDIETSGKWRVHGPASASVSFGTQPRESATVGKTREMFGDSGSVWSLGDARGRATR